MKYHPDYPMSIGSAKEYTQKEIDKLKKKETEAAAEAYKLSRRLGKRDKNHAEAYGDYLHHKANLAELRRYERTGEWTNNMVPGTDREVFYRVVAEAYDNKGKLKSAPKGALVDSFGRIVNDGDVSNGYRK